MSGVLLGHGIPRFVDENVRTFTLPGYCSAFGRTLRRLCGKDVPLATYHSSNANVECTELNPIELPSFPTHTRTNSAIPSLAFHVFACGLVRQDQKQLSYWLCPGCSADVRDKERREKVEKVKSPTASQAGAQSSAVKVSDKGERSGEGATEAAASAGVPPAAAGISAEGRAANLKLTNDANVPDERASTPAGKETKEQSGGSHAPVDAARSDKAQNYTSPQKDEDSQAPSSVWQGLGGMGGNALPEGTGLDRSGAEIVPGEKRGDTEGSDRRGNGTVAVTGGTSTSSEAASALAVAAGTLAVTSDGPTPEDNAETRTHLVVAAQGKGE